eukprot:gene7417-7626_t
MFNALHPPPPTGLEMLRGVMAASGTASDHVSSGSAGAGGGGDRSLQKPAVAQKDSQDSTGLVLLQSDAFEKMGSHSGSVATQEYAPGVYLSLQPLPAGGLDLKRVRFSKQLFTSEEAEQWWHTHKGEVWAYFGISPEQQLAGSSGSAVGTSLACELPWGFLATRRHECFEDAAARPSPSLRAHSEGAGEEATAHSKVASANSAPSHKRSPSERFWFFARSSD